MHIESVHFNLVANVAGGLSKFEDHTYSWKQYIFGKVVWHHLTSTQISLQIYTVDHNK